MLLSKKAKIEAVCSSEETRQNLGSPYLEKTPEGAWLVAADGHAMVALAVEETLNDHSGYIAVDALRALRKAGPRAEMACNGSCAVPGGATFPRPDVGTFPDWQQVMPKEREGERSVSFSVTLLRRIVEAAGGNGEVTLYMTDDPGAPIRVHVYDSAEPHRAVLMPVRR